MLLLACHLHCGLFWLKLARFFSGMHTNSQPRMRAELFNLGQAETPRGRNNGSFPHVQLKCCKNWHYQQKVIARYQVTSGWSTLLRAASTRWRTTRQKKPLKNVWHRLFLKVSSFSLTQSQQVYPMSALNRVSWVCWFSKSICISFSLGPASRHLRWQRFCSHQKGKPWEGQ